MSTNIVIHQVTTLEEMQNLGSALSWEGMNIDQDNLEKIFSWIEEYSPVKNKQIYLIKGKTMNKCLNLSYDYLYNNDLNIVCIDLNDIEEPQKLAIPRLEVGGRWLDDIIDNNIHRTEAENNTKEKYYA